jgi:hypothetical protein
MSYSKILGWRGWAGASLAALGFTAMAQVTIPESVALPSGSYDPAKLGFTVRVHQTTTENGTLPNSLARAEAQLAGFLVNPTTGEPYENIADLQGWLFHPDGTYDEPFTIDYDAGTFPGIPGLEGTTDNIAMEATTYIPLTPGTYGMIVNIDDGFRVTTGNPLDRADEIVLGEFDGGRGAADTFFTFEVTKEGVYPFRLIYEQGAGGMSVSWYSADPDDPTQRGLLNADAGLPCYRALKTGVQKLGPSISGLMPLPGSENIAPSSGISILIEDQDVAFDAATFHLYHNDQEVTADATIHPKKDGKTRIDYTAPTLPAPLSAETYRAEFADATQADGKRVATWSYTVANYANFTLTDPIWFEDFESTDEGEIPDGWTRWSPIAPSGTEDLNDPHSDSYLMWTVISVQRMRDIGDAGGWNAQRRLNTPEAYINGERLESLMNGKFAYMESDVRGGSQYSELLTPVIDLSGKTDVHLVFYSAYTQNQDNIAGVEYSIDGGNTWMPVMYMIDAPDIILNDAGEVDAVATLTEPRGDTATYTDPDTGEQKGGFYGAFLKVPEDQWADLGPYIQGRVNDDQWESKRVEKYRLPLADNQSQVQIRFLYAGTASWFWGIDNVGLYSMPEGAAPELAYSVAGDQLTLTWEGAGYTLQVNTDLGNPDGWTDVPDAGENSATVTMDGAAAFYRLKK